MRLCRDGGKKVVVTLDNLNVRKISVAQRFPARHRAHVLRTAKFQMRSSRRPPEQVKQSFQLPTVKYAA